MESRDIHTVMVVDDDVKLLAMLEQALQGELELELCENVQSALALLNRYTPDLLLLDLSLPDGDAFMVLEHVNTHLPTPLVVLMSGTAVPAQSFKLAQLGVQGYLTKPFDLAQLRQTMEQAASTPPDIRPQLRNIVGQRSIHEVEAEVRSAMLNEALARTGGSRRSAARLLEVSRQLVQHMLRKGR